MVRNCPNRKQDLVKAAGAHTGKGRFPTKKVTFKEQDSEGQRLKEEEHEPQAEEKVCGACYFYTNTMT